MSTRANIIIKDGADHLFFYRHSDGYPSGVAPSLNKFVKFLQEGRIRNNISQGAGWLILLGAIEYGSLPKVVQVDGTDFPNVIVKDWKVGAYEPTTGLHGDIEHLYVIDLQEMRVKELKIEWDIEPNKPYNYRTIKEDWTKFKVIPSKVFSDLIEA